MWLWKAAFEKISRYPETTYRLDVLHITSNIFMKDFDPEAIVILSLGQIIQIITA